MIWVHKERLANWCNKNIDFLIIVLGAVILLSTNQFGYNIGGYTAWQDIGFWALLIGVVTLSIGTSAFICYRVLLKWHGFFR